MFYDYVRGRAAQSDFTKELDRSIAKLKEEKEERQMYLTYTSRMMECRQDGYEQGLYTGREQGISIGLERGRVEAYQSKLETAKSMLSIGLSTDQVQLCTQLPLQTITQLMQEL